MAKKIKAVKCPQCGSSKAKELRTDYYRCISCHTEYFLDSDDININHYHHNAPTATTENHLYRKIAVIAMLTISTVFFIFFITNLGSNKSAIDDIIKSESWSNSKVYGLETPGGQSVYVKVGTIRNSDYTNESHRIMAAFYDAKALKEIKRIQLPLNVKRLEANFKYFTDGTLYMIVNEKRLFTIDKQQLLVEEVLPESLKDIPGMESGFANIKFGIGDDVKMDFFEILNNQGQSVYYYPIIKKSFIGREEFNRARDSDELMPANSPIVTRFAFSSVKSFEEEIVQLIKYQSKITEGYPVLNPYFSWGETYYGEKKLLSDSYKKYSKIVNYEDFTPKRLYFRPSVLGYNNQYVVITYKPTPAAEETFVLQVLDANTANVLWTVDLNSESAYPDNSLITKDGIFSFSFSKANFYSFTGKEISELK